MPPYHFTNGLGYSHDELVAMFNLSFTGYYFPMNQTPAEYATFCRSYHIDFTHSLIMLDETGAFVGMTRMGARGQRGWCGGFGIAPPFRGHGAAKVLAQRMVQEARAAGWRTLQLEVLVQNTPAIRVYQSIGLKNSHRLIGFELKLDATLPPCDAVQPQRIPVEAFPWGLYQQQTLAWQREISSVVALATHAVQITRVDGQLTALLYEQRGRRIIIHGIVGDLSQPDVIAQLLGTIVGDADAVYAPNECAESESIAMYRILGFHEMYQEYEMKMDV